MRVARKAAACLSLLALLAGHAASIAQNGTQSEAGPICEKPVYLTIDTGHMGVATQMIDVLNRQNVKATFFLANERTKTGGSSMDDVWAPWWKQLAEQGHVFGSHTFDHVYWQADLPDGTFRVKASAGPDANKVKIISGAEYCQELDRARDRFEQMTGKKMVPIFRSAGGKTSPALLAAAKTCGYTHVPWTPAGFMGDELPSEKYPNAALLDKALRTVKAGEIILVHLGIWSRKDPWAPSVFEPLIAGLKDQGFCFATLDQHPDYQGAMRTKGGRSE